MIVMFTSSFYNEFELYKTDNSRSLINQVKNAYYNGGDIDTKNNFLIGCQDDFTTEIALKIADEVVYLENE